MEEKKCYVTCCFVLNWFKWTVSQTVQLLCGKVLRLIGLIYWFKKLWRLRHRAVGMKEGTDVIKVVQKILCKSERAGGWHNWWAFSSVWLVRVQKSRSWISKSAHTLWPDLSTHIYKLGYDKDIESEFLTGKISIKMYGRTSLLVPWKRAGSWLNLCKINWTVWHVRSFAFHKLLSSLALIQKRKQNVQNKHCL